MLKLKARLPRSTRPSLDASPRIVSSLRISDAIMSGLEMAEESFVTLRTKSSRDVNLPADYRSTPSWHMIWAKWLTSGPLFAVEAPVSMGRKS
jgi:hypothetical protein